MLPRMTMGNWLFWAIVVWIGVNLIWLGVFTKLPAWIGAAIATALAFVVFRYGPRPKEAEEEQEE